MLTLSEPEDHQTAVIYTRSAVKINDQDRQQSEEKLNACRAFAHQEGMEIIRECSDDGVSGLLTDRPGLNEALELIRSRAATVLLCYAPGDLSRRVDSLLEIMDQVIGWDGTLSISTSPIREITDPTSDITGCAVKVCRRDDT
jgi:DNA invertase Pin-like site-specific DNA recombinase